MNFLGVRIDELNRDEALKKIGGFLEQYKIFTPNPEMLVKAQKDEYFRKVLNAGDLNICDGAGISLFTGIKRITGVDFMLDICALCEAQNKSVFLLGSGRGEVVEKTAENLQKKYPNLKIVEFDQGPKIVENSDGGLRYVAEGENTIVLDKINEARPDIVFVAFGMGKQEKWIYENLEKMPSVKVAMGVGGSFDYLAGSAKRAPKFMRSIGLEWVFRLVREPKRFVRIFNATVVFSVLFLKSKFKDN
ncbi:MAG: WecB/TagA/CpsF family glycosyltransferase [bacterium]|nr:WecB/TagA/CpsF family glycosyltransferase [bacterium]